MRFFDAERRQYLEVDLAEQGSERAGGPQRSRKAP